MGKSKGAADEPTDTKGVEPAELPALFATIHFRSEDRPNGYTPDEIAKLNELANKPSASRKR